MRKSDESETVEASGVTISFGPKVDGALAPEVDGGGDVDEVREDSTEVPLRLQQANDTLNLDSLLMSPKEVAREKPVLENEESGNFRIRTSFSAEQVRRDRQSTQQLLEAKKRTLEFPPVDYGSIDVREEAAQGHSLNTGELVYQTLLHAFFPLTVPLLWATEGRHSVEMHCWCFGGNAHEAVRNFSHEYKANAGGLKPFQRVIGEYIGFGFPAVVLMTGAILFVVGYLPLNSPVLPDLVIGWLFHMFIQLIRGGIKYGFRSPAAKKRLIDHAARRHEEFSFGWYHLPDEWAIFLTRLCAAEARLPMDAVVVLEHLQGNQNGQRTQPDFGETRFAAPHLLEGLRQDSQGRIHVPAAAVLLELVLPLRGPPGSDKQAIPPKENQGSLGVVFRFMMLASIVSAGLPSILRAIFLEREWTPNGFEVLILVSAGLLIFAGTNFVNMILNAATLVLRRKLILMHRLGALIDGVECAFGDWRVATSVVQMETWDGMRRALASFGKNYEVRSVANLAMLFLTILLCKVFVFFLFFYKTVSNVKWRLKSEPVIPVFVTLLPLLFTPVVLLAFYNGAKLNETGKRRLEESLIFRERELVLERTRYLEKLHRGECSEKQLDLEDRRLECCQQAIQLVLQTIQTQSKPMVLLGFGGEGLFVFSYPMLVSFIAENFVNAVMMGNVVTFS